MTLLRNKVSIFMESIWFNILICSSTVISFIFDIPYFGFYVAVTCLLLIVLLKKDFKNVLPIILLIFGNHQTFVRDFTDFRLILLIAYFGCVVIIFLCNVIRNYKNFFKYLSKDFVFYTLLAITFAMILSLINTPVIAESMIGLTLWVTILFSYILVRATVDKTEENKDKIIESILLSGLVLCIMVIYKFFQALSLGYSMQVIIKRKEIKLGWANINHVAAFVNICIFIANYYFIRNKSIFKKIFAIISIVIYCFISAISLCRGGYLSLLFTIPLLIIINIAYILKSAHKVKIKLLYFMSVLLAIGCIFLILQLTGIKNILITILSNKRFDPSGRKDVYSVAIERFKAHPIIGQGVYSARYFLDHLNLNIFNYHNYYLQMLGTCGIIGALAFTLFLIFSIKRCIKKDLFSLFTILVMLYFLIHGALDTLFFNAYIMPILCVLLAVTMDSKIKDEFPSLFKKRNINNEDELRTSEIETD